MRRSSVRFRLLLAALSTVPLVVACGSKGGDGDGDGGPNGPGGPGNGQLPGEAGAPGSAIGTTGLENGGLGSDWNADPDGDGVRTPEDKCPYVYDPGQADGNGDGVGDACDAAVDAPKAGKPIDDLRAEHVTPYGAWLTFRSNENNQYGYSTDVAWTDTPGAIGAKAGFDAAVAKKDSVRVRVDQRLGDRIPLPALVQTLKPGTKYFFAVRDGQNRIGKVLEITTPAAPDVKLAAAYPRVYATPALVDELKARASKGDAAWNTWKGQLQPRLDRALNDSDIEGRKYCIAGAILFLGTGDRAVLDKAKRLHGELLKIWQANNFGGNEFRWSDAALGVCTDLLWNELDAATREASVAAMLAVDEPTTLPTHTDYRIDDTDECHSSIRTWLIDGLVGCNAPGIPSALSDRACQLLEHGKRNFWNVMGVEMKRDRGWLALSGGHMPDSTSYGSGSSLYWTMALWALHNAGVSIGESWPWVAHNLAATYLHATTPRLRGLATYGDVDKYADNQASEPASAAINLFHLDLAAMQIGLLHAAGRDKEAGWARFYMNKVSKPDNFQNRAHMLLFDTAAIPEVDWRTQIPPSFYDSGFGMLYDRTSWSDRGSMLVARAGWTGVDHSQEEQGHFQWYRRGRWLTHESIAYEGEAAQAPGHNVMQMEVLYNNDARRVGQYAFRNDTQPRFVRSSTGNLHAYAHAELTGMYRSSFTAFYTHDAVQRALVWLKGSEADGSDALVVYDLVDSGASLRGAREWLLHVDAAPRIEGRKATVDLDGPMGKQTLEVAVLLPTSAELSAKAPEGAPGNSSDAIWTHRLAADPKVSDPKLRFVTVLQAGDQGKPLPNAAAIDAGAWVGAQVGGTAVLLPREPVPATAPKGAAPAQAELTIALPGRVYWAGHAPAQGYDVRATVAGGKVTLDAGPGGAMKADRGGMLVVDVAADGAVTAVYK